MRTRWMTLMLTVLILTSLTACAESLHQTQRLEMMASAGGYEGVDGYYDEAFYGPLGYWGYPFGYFSGFYGPGYGPGYGYGYPYYYGSYGRRPSSPSGPSSRAAPPSNAPRQFLKRR